MGGCGWLNVHVRMVLLLVHDRKCVRVLVCGGGGLGRAVEWLCMVRLALALLVVSVCQGALPWVWVLRLVMPFLL